MKRFIISLLTLISPMFFGNMASTYAQQLPPSGVWGKFADVVDAYGELELTGDVDMVGVIRIPEGKTLKLTSKKNITIRNTGIGSSSETTPGRSRMFTAKGNGGKLIIEADEGCTITLDGGADFTWNNYTLTPGENSRTLSEAICNEGTLELTNVIIRNVNGSNNNGGAIYIDGGADGPTTLTGCTIEKCYSQLGSAIMILGSEPVTITNSLIQYCNSGGGTQDNSGGAIRTYGSVSASLYLTDTKFLYNYAQRNQGYNNELVKDGNGGALFWNARGTNDTKCVISGCEFGYNKSDDNGGAIKSQATIEFVDKLTEIHHNSAPVGGGLYIEGYTGGSTVSGARTIRYSFNEFMKVHDNISPSYEYNEDIISGKGAGIHLYFGDEMNLEAGSTIQLDMNGAQIYNNVSEGDDSNGGGIYFENISLPAKNYIFDIQLNYGDIVNNSAGNGGGIYVSKGEVRSTNIDNKPLSISQNSASLNGAGIYIKDGSLSMANGNIIENSITGTGNGGGIFIENGNFEIDAGTVSRNSVQDGSGGGVFIVGSQTGETITGNFIMNGGSITDNSAAGTTETSGFGGGVYVQGGNFTLSESAETGSISGNTSTKDGGGVYINGGQFIQNKGTIGSNISSSNGGGVCIVNGGTFTMTGGNITDNGKGSDDVVKTQLGGGVYLNGGNFVLTNGTISGNKAALNGGGVFLTGDECTYQLQNGNIAGNSAGNGGGVYLEKGLFILGNQENLNNGNITDNIAVKGGGVYIGDGTNSAISDGSGITEGFIMYGGNITDNSTQEEGGGVYLNGGDFTQHNGTIRSNSSDTHGGGIYLDGGNFTQNGGTIDNNISTVNGGGVCIDGGNFTMNGGKITDNGKNGETIVTDNGGGVYLNGGKLQVSEGEISSNTSLDYGGGIYILNGEVEMGAGVINSNRCNIYGGGVYVFNDQDTYIDVNFTGGTLSENSAKYGGGICVNGKIRLSIGNVEIAENAATNGGGVCLMNNADMTFGAGQIKNNKAIIADGSAVYSGVTAYQTSIDNLNGMGGGVYLDSNTKLTFASSEELGLFGNRADNGADELFANGDNTTVNIPDVTTMKLDGYTGAGNLKWIEDYITNDTGYLNGTNLLGYTDQTENKTVMRYRDMISQNYQNIPQLIGGISVESEDAKKYICFALGYEVIFITITKNGLAAGESAVFTLEKVNTTDNSNGGGSGDDSSTNEDIKFRVILTGDGQNTIRKKVAVTAGTWKISESGWTWSYNETGAIEQDVTDGKQREFVFNNQKKDALPLYHESFIVTEMGDVD